MRTKDENKIKAIKEAVIDLCQESGFTNLTTAKVAKAAGISPATIYLYYQDKTDMLSRLYEEVKMESHKGLAGVIADAGEDVTDQLRAMLFFSVRQAQNNPKVAHFLSVLWMNQELLDKQARAFGETEVGPILSLYQRIKDDPTFIDFPEPVITTFATVPTTIAQISNDDDADNSVKIAVDLVIKALKVDGYSKD